MVKKPDYKVAGILLDECAIGILPFLHSLRLPNHWRLLPPSELPVTQLPQELYGKPDLTVQGYAYEEKFLIVTYDSGKSDGKGFCLDDDTLPARCHGVILLANEKPEENARKLQKHAATIKSYILHEDREQFFIDLRADQPIICAWMSRAEAAAKLKSGVVHALSYLKLSRDQIQDIPHQILQEGHRNITFEASGRSVVIEVTENAMENKGLLRQAIEFLVSNFMVNSDHIVAGRYLLKNTRAGIIEILKNKNRIYPMEQTSLTPSP